MDGWMNVVSGACVCDLYGGRGRSEHHRLMDRSLCRNRETERGRMDIRVIGTHAFFCCCHCCCYFIALS